MTLTPEMTRIIAAAQTGQDVVVEARAGTGKTTTAIAVACARPVMGLYLAFNRSVAQEAAPKLPDHFTAKTMHALAYAAVVKPSPAFTRKFKAGGGQITNALLARHGKGLLVQHTNGNPAAKALGQGPLLSLVRSTLHKFCNSAAESIAEAHLPSPQKPEVTALALTLAKAFWFWMCDPSSPMPIDHGGYVKLWQLSRPHLPYGCIIVDEAQDLNEVLWDVLQYQQAQLILIGDRAQSIYTWRGSVNVLAMYEGQPLTLSRTFRFGQAVAELANDVLLYGGETQNLLRSERDDTAVRLGNRLLAPVTVLCRTRAGLLEAVLAFGERQTIAFIGDHRKLVELLKGLFALHQGEWVSHPRLTGYTDWKELVVACELLGEDDLKSLIEAVERHAEQMPAMIALLERSLVAPSEASVLIGTIHAAKGNEWDNVLLWNDLTCPKPCANYSPQEREELNLLYVAVTRARQNLWLTHCHSIGAFAAALGRLNRTLGAAHNPQNPVQRFAQRLGRTLN